MEDRIQELAEQFRTELHDLVDKRIDEFISFAKEKEHHTGFERTWPVSVNPSVFKGKKPLHITFADGRKVMTPTWKQVAVAILSDCSSDETMHARLSEMCGKVFGKNRLILAAQKDEMDIPLKIDDGIYFEGKFDAESLIRVMTTRVLDAVGYDYSGIEIKIVDRYQPQISDRDNTLSEIEENLPNLQL